MDPTDRNLAFDDPGLKAAVDRAWGSERAPASLRASVMALRSDSASSITPPAILGTIRPDTTSPSPATIARPAWWQRPILRYGVAAAAMVLLGFGIAFKLDDTPFGRERFATTTGAGGTEVTFASTVPQPIARGLLESHERCSKYPDHNVYPELSRDDFAAVRQRLERRLGFPVLAGNVEEALGRNGWRFKGAAVCKVGDLETAHLVFVRQGQAISIFSLPPHTCREGDGRPRECEDANPDHPVAVFVWSDGVHCVVGSSNDRSLSVDQVRSVLEHLRPTLPAPAPR
jgi:hypothetical protein